MSRFADRVYDQIFEEASTLSAEVPAFRTGFPTSFEWRGDTWLKLRDVHDRENELVTVEYTSATKRLTVFND